MSENKKCVCDLILDQYDANIEILDKKLETIEMMLAIAKPEDTPLQDVLEAQAHDLNEFRRELLIQKQMLFEPIVLDTISED